MLPFNFLIVALLELASRREKVVWQVTVNAFSNTHNRLHSIAVRSSLGVTTQIGPFCMSLSSSTTGFTSVSSARTHAPSVAAIELKLGNFDPPAVWTGPGRA